MNTLKQSAAAFNLYKVEDIPAKYRGDSFDHRIKCGHKDIPDFLKTCPGYEVGLFYECRQDTDYNGKVTYYIEHSYILVQRGSGLLLMLMQERGGKYYLHPYFGILHQFNNLSHYLKNERTRAINEPNKIGVFTAKKLDDWANYCEDYYRALSSLLDDVEGENAKIEAKISDFIKNTPGAIASTYQNITDVETPLFRVRFRHSKGEKYLQTEIDFRGSVDDVTKICNLLCS